VGGDEKLYQCQNLLAAVAGINGEQLHRRAQSHEAVETVIIPSRDWGMQSTGGRRLPARGMMSRWRLFGVVAGFALGSVCAWPAVAQRTKVVAYTAIENEQLPVFKAAIEQAVPDVEIDWVRDSTGVITARFLAEKDRPRADIVFSLAVSSVILFKRAGLLEAYMPKGSDGLKPQFKDAANPAAWFGHDAFLGAVWLQYDRRRKGRCYAAQVLERGDQSQARGQGGDVASRFIRHRLPDGGGLAADDG
jgi:hypothetical protein